MLVIEGLPQYAKVSLSGKSLVAGDLQKFDVTEHLQLTNRIEIEVSGANLENSKEFPFEVQLQITEK